MALAAAVCLFLSSIEYLIPKPLPFLRLGLANLPLLVCLDLLPAGPFLLLLALKAAGQGLVQGSLFSVIFLFSAAGTLASGAVMLGSRHLLGNRISLIGISVLGALASNLVQLGSGRGGRLRTVGLAHRSAFSRRGPGELRRAGRPGPGLRAPLALPAAVRRLRRLQRRGSGRTLKT